jgi:Ca2+-binding RTX toxin-like protein
MVNNGLTDCVRIWLHARCPHATGALFTMTDKINYIFGTAKAEFLYTGIYPASVVYGMDGNDVIEDQTVDGALDSGADYFYGNYGNDVLISHAGADVLGGGDGKDTLVVDKQLDDTKTVTLRGGSGNNTAVIVTEDPSHQDFNLPGKDRVLHIDGYDVKLHRIQHVDFMTADEYADFKAGWDQHAAADVLI